MVVCTPVASIPRFVSHALTARDWFDRDRRGKREKGEICRAAEEAGGEGAFLGSHPIAGSEKSGMGFASADLFEDRPCILTPTGTTDQAVRDTTRAFWERLGMKVHFMTPDEHDQALLSSVTCLTCLPPPLPIAWMARQGTGRTYPAKVSSTLPGLPRGILPFGSRS